MKLAIKNLNETHEFMIIFALCLIFVHQLFNYFGENEIWEGLIPQHKLSQLYTPKIINSYIEEMAFIENENITIVSGIEDTQKWIYDACYTQHISINQKLSAYEYSKTMKEISIAAINIFKHKIQKQQNSFYEIGFYIFEQNTYLVGVLDMHKIGDFYHPKYKSYAICRAGTFRFKNAKINRLKNPEVLGYYFLNKIINDKLKQRYAIDTRNYILSMPNKYILLLFIIAVVRITIKKYINNKMPKWLKQFVHDLCKAFLTSNWQYLSQKPSHFNSTMLQTKPKKTRKFGSRRTLKHQIRFNV